MNWNKLPLLPHIKKNEQFYKAINNVNWQRTRLSMKGISTLEKYNVLMKYAKDNASNALMPIQITNYYFALKRGGLIK